MPVRAAMATICVTSITMHDSGGDRRRADAAADRNRQYASVDAMTSGSYVSAAFLALAVAVADFVPAA